MTTPSADRMALARLLTEARTEYDRAADLASRAILKNHMPEVRVELYRLAREAAARWVAAQRIFTLPGCQDPRQRQACVWILEDLRPYSRRSCGTWLRASQQGGAK